MRTIILKVLCWMCVVVMTNVFAFQNKYLYTNSKTKDYNKNYRHHAHMSAHKSTTPYSSNSLYDLNNKPVRLRHSRYPNLNSVMSRLDSMQSTVATLTSTSTTTQTPPTTSSPYRSYKSNRRANLFFDDYTDADEEYDNEGEEDDDWNANDANYPFDQKSDVKDEDEDEDEGEGEDEDLDDNDSWQAEEATTETHIPAPVLDYKSRPYGTQNQIEETSKRKNYPEYPSATSEVNRAIQHALKMNNMSRCREPLPRVVAIQSEYADPEKSYVPHCTVLHRCAEDTGCCPNHATICAPKTQVVVQLYFYTTSIGKPGHKIEKLEFTNHTECACLEKPRDALVSENDSPEVSRSYRSHLPAKVMTPQNSHPTLPQPLLRCTCPEEYTPILLKNSGCTCDCTDSNMDCALIKRGNEFFSLKDRLCIKNNQCSTPNCEYGQYLTNIGRCPRRHERNDLPTGVN